MLTDYTDYRLANVMTFGMMNLIASTVENNTMKILNSK